MSHNNDSGKFFKFKNLQLVRRQNTTRQTRQNTDLRMQGTAEEQFAAITATARADALREIDNISYALGAAWAYSFRTSSLLVVRHRIK